jgi:bile acid:Na+ symporter, BASS family
MSRLLAFLGGHATWVLFVGVFLGLALPSLASLARPLLAPAVAVLLTATLVRVDWRVMLDTLRRPGLVAVIVAWLLVGAPVATTGVLALLPLPGPLSTALVLMAAAPPILSAAPIAIILGLDGALALVVGLIATLLTPLTVPPLALALLGLELDLGVTEFMVRLAVVVAVALAAAVVIRRAIGRERLPRVARHLDGLVVTVMLVFAVAIMDGVTATLAARPGVVALWLLASFIANPALQIAGTIAFAWLGRRRALTIGLVSGNCNMGLLLAAFPPGTDADVVLYFAVAQLPMYMLPALLLPLYRRLVAPAADPKSPSIRAG